MTYDVSNISIVNTGTAYPELNARYRITGTSGCKISSKYSYCVPVPVPVMGKKGAYIKKTLNIIKFGIMHRIPVLVQNFVGYRGRLGVRHIQNPEQDISPYICIDKAVNRIRLNTPSGNSI
jgi:hypothetical protein